MKIIQNQSPNFSDRTNGAVNHIILHYTGMQSGAAALDRMCEKAAQVSAHYYISRTGEIYQLVDENKKAWHAGVSFWAGQENLNETSIGIEIENKGHQWGYVEFTDIQISNTISLCHQIINRYHINLKNIIAHSDIAPTRKEDPGELFPWLVLAQNNVAIHHDFDIQNYEYENGFLSLNSSGKSVLDMQEKLSAIGYKIDKTGVFDEQTSMVVSAFNRRFFQTRIIMLCQNKRYPEIVGWDSKSDKIALQIIEKSA